MLEGNWRRNRTAGGLKEGFQSEIQDHIYGFSSFFYPLDDFFLTE